MPKLDLNVLPLVLTVDEAAAVLRISRGSAYEAVRAGELPHVRFGRTIRVPRHALLSQLGVAPSNEREGASGPGLVGESENGQVPTSISHGAGAQDGGLA